MSFGNGPDRGSPGTVQALPCSHVKGMQEVCCPKTSMGWCSLQCTYKYYKNVIGLAARELGWFATAEYGPGNRVGFPGQSKPSPAVMTRESMQFTVKMHAYPGVLCGRSVIPTEMSSAKL